MLCLLEFSNCTSATPASITLAKRPAKHQCLENKTTIADATFSSALNGSCKPFSFKLIGSRVEPRVNGFTRELWMRFDEVQAEGRGGSLRA